jgi:hypothetical protein
VESFYKAHIGPAFTALLGVTLNRGCHELITKTPFLEERHAELGESIHKPERVMITTCNLLRNHEVGK